MNLDSMEQSNYSEIRGENQQHQRSMSVDVGLMPDDVDDNAPIHASSAHPNVLAESTLGDLHE